MEGLNVYTESPQKTDGQRSAELVTELRNELDAAEEWAGEILPQLDNLRTENAHQSKELARLKVEVDEWKNMAETNSNGQSNTTEMESTEDGSESGTIDALKQELADAQSQLADSRATIASWKIEAETAVASLSACRSNLQAGEERENNMVMEAEQREKVVAQKLQEIEERSEQKLQASAAREKEALGKLKESEASRKQARHDLESYAREKKALRDLEESEAREKQALRNLEESEAREKQALRDLAETEAREKQALRDLAESGAREKQALRDLEESEAGVKGEPRVLAESEAREKKALRDLEESEAREKMARRDQEKSEAREKKALRDLEESNAREEEAVDQLQELQEAYKRHVLQKKNNVQHDEWWKQQATSCKRDLESKQELIQQLEGNNLKMKEAIAHSEEVVKNTAKECQLMKTKAACLENDLWEMSCKQSLLVEEAQQDAAATLHTEMANKVSELKKQLKNLEQAQSHQATKSEPRKKNRSGTKRKQVKKPKKLELQLSVDEDCVTNVRKINMPPFRVVHSGGIVLACILSFFIFYHI